MEGISRPVVHRLPAAAGLVLTLTLALAVGAAACGDGDTGDDGPAAGAYDLVIEGGRVMDPESGLDATRNVGIRDGRIATVTAAPLSGERMTRGASPRRGRRAAWWPSTAARRSRPGGRWPAPSP